ncbi:MAG: hypothetical protein LBC60_07920 [Spirochaetaceae bacterium]|jgi:Na+-transporting NADH:ubiquinone oxidoreductase subunit NqrD|nr:hypothetical protein [Spirochaetaceae bacterium]
MKEAYKNRLFGGIRAPLSSLTDMVFLIIASGRTAFALIALGALVWVYGMTVIGISLGKPIIPQKGKKILHVFLSAFFGSLYLMILNFLNPLLALECTLFVILAPVSCISSEIINRVESMEPEDALAKTLLEALALGILIVALALIREPFGFGSLSIPGGTLGIIELFNRDTGGIIPLRIVSSSSGAFLLLGYGMALFRFYRKRADKAEHTE